MPAGVFCSSTFLSDLRRFQELLSRQPRDHSRVIGPGCDAALYSQLVARGAWLPRMAQRKLAGRSMLWWSQKPLLLSASSPSRLGRDFKDYSNLQLVLGEGAQDLNPVGRIHTKSGGQHWMHRNDLVLF